eukprot:scaffold74161_cov65-Attheya_sp.AAC.2
MGLLVTPSVPPEVTPPAPPDPPRMPAMHQINFEWPYNIRRNVRYWTFDKNKAATVPSRVHRVLQFNICVTGCLKYNTTGSYVAK